MILLGKDLIDKNMIAKELRKFFGVGRSTAPSILARLSIANRSKVEDLTEAQVASLTAYLSSTTISELPPRTPVVDPAGRRELLAGEKDKISEKQREEEDWGRQTLIENELRNKINRDIGTLISIGTYRGRRHRQNKPMSSRSKHNAQTALRLNRPRRHFSTLTDSMASTSSSPSPFAPFRTLFSSRFRAL